MRKLLIWGFAVTALIGSSLASGAADLGVPVYKASPTPPPPAFYWTGFYVGGHAGCGWAHTPAPSNVFDPTQGLVSGLTSSTEQATGCFGGGQIGVNYQFVNNFVVGIEGDASLGKISSFNRTTGDDAALAAWEDKLTGFGTVRGRLGYAINGALPWFGGLGWMPYVTGGWAWGQNKISGQGDAGTFLSDNQILNGWTVGVGLEYAITPFMTWKAEYLFMEFASKTFAFDNDAAVTLDANFGPLKVNVFRTGLNWRFGGGLGY